MENGASEGTRTLMRKAQDPKSCASTNSATLAYSFTPGKQHIMIDNPNKKVNVYR